MGLVDYSDDSEGEEQTPAAPPPAKKRKVSASGERELPPLPASFLDQYSSTVRTGTQDDPSLHGGRKRLTPHVDGNWPTHVYLEWHPQPTEHKSLSDIVSAANKWAGVKVNSLLENDLGVALPLHISLSRPLVLKTAQKDNFLARLRQMVSDSNIKAFDTQPRDLAWHPNETRTRWFLVLRLQTSSGRELNKLLEASNGLARDFEQPVLYAEAATLGSEASDEQFHISIGWALQRPPSMDADAARSVRECRSSASEGAAGVPYELLGKASSLSLGFNEVKVRIGQDVHSIPLKTRRQTGLGVVKANGNG